MTKKLKVGDRASRTKAFSQEEVNQFARISTDTNPIHLDETFAAASIFGQRIVHGMLVSSLFSGILGAELPGEGTIYLGQNVSFKAPVPVGEEVTASVEVVKIRDDKPIVTLRTVCVDSQDRVVVDGEAVVMVP